MTEPSRPACVVLVVSLGLHAQGPSKADLITVPELKQWLGYIASDELEGRGNFSEGLALAAGYIADNLKDWGVKPGGDHGGYFQRVAVLGVQNKGTATVTVEVNGQSKTFKLGDGIEIPKNMGAARTLTADQIEFVGYGISLPGGWHRRLQGPRGQRQDRRLDGRPGTVDARSGQVPARAERPGPYGDGAGRRDRGHRAGDCARIRRAGRTRGPACGAGGCSGTGAAAAGPGGSGDADGRPGDSPGGAGLHDGPAPRRRGGAGRLGERLVLRVPVQWLLHALRHAESSGRQT